MARMAAKMSKEARPFESVAKDTAWSRRIRAKNDSLRSVSILRIGARLIAAEYQEDADEDQRAAGHDAPSDDFAGDKISESYGDDWIHIGMARYARGGHVRQQPDECREGQQRSDDDEVKQRHGRAEI